MSGVPEQGEAGQSKLNSCHMTLDNPYNMITFYNDISSATFLKAHLWLKPNISRIQF